MIRSLYRGDCLNVLEDYVEPESVDLVYLDPPFNSKSTYNLPFKGKDKTHKPVSAFKDTWTWQDTPDESGASDNDRLEELRRHPQFRDLAFLVDLARRQDTHQNSMGSYILSMTSRLQAIYKVLKPTGSIYLHCDPTAKCRERLAYPIVQLPLEMTRPDGRLFRSKMMWLGFAIAGGINLINGLSVFLFSGTTRTPGAPRRDWSILHPKAVQRYRMDTRLYSLLRRWTCFSDTVGDVFFVQLPWFFFYWFWKGELPGYWGARLD